MQRTNTVFPEASKTKKNFPITLTSLRNVIKLYIAVIYKCL